MKPVRYQCAQCARRTHFVMERATTDYKDTDYRRLRWKLCVSCFKARLEAAHDAAMKRFQAEGGQCQ